MEYAGDENDWCWRPFIPAGKAWKYFKWSQQFLNAKQKWLEINLNALKIATVYLR